MRLRRLLPLLFLLGCSGGEEPKGAASALEELQAKYDELAEGTLGQPVQWASDDLENIGDWEYKVVDISRWDAERMETELNVLGDDRWQVVWVDSLAGQRVVLLKRPAVSWLSKIPLSQLGRLVLGEGDGGQ